MGTFAPQFSFLENLVVDQQLADGEARLAAIDPYHSFIVQAPAGSGKTSLLTQRYLALLSQVTEPEQIVAMTFTQKAAAEMQERIVEALKSGLEPLPAEANIYQQNTWHLARLALQQNDRQQWNLLQNPQRLRLRTIDSLNAYLVQQMPLLSTLGAEAKVTDRPQELYQQAARATLQEASVEEQVASIFRLVNGSFKRAEALLVSMLAKRDQWMPLLSGFEQDEINKNRFDQALSVLVTEIFCEHLQTLKPILPLLEEARLNSLYIAEAHKPELLSLTELDLNKLFSGQNLPGLGDFQNWRLLAGVLLTKSGSFKKRLTKTEGYPAKTDAEKQQKQHMIECLEVLATQDVDGHYAQSIQAMAELPAPAYDAEQWQQLLHLMTLLQTAAAHLKLVFAETAQTDFIEIAQSASQALGTELEPTELAQRLDYQIHHLLIDEFQDTSVSQFELLKKLVAGWSEDDQHTLFIVGDPMQSIYRFREAEVGNFLEAWEGQVGPVLLRQLQLTVNFRSQQGIVDWVNDTFRHVFPAENKIEKGAVSYTASTAFQPAKNPAVLTHWQLNQSAEEEAEWVVQLVKQRISDTSDHSQIGILGRSRSHLMPIALALKEAGVAFKATELELLADRQEIQDCQALTRALLHLGDRPAWLALLRSPAVGLDLQQLYTLLGQPDEFSQPVWKLLKLHFDDLPVENQQGLQSVMETLDRALTQVGEVSWAQLVLETWLALDMPQTLETEAALQNVEAYLQMLSVLEQSPGGLNTKVLETELESLFALGDDSEASQMVELMTMHKSKGLEFDTVILPGLGRPPRMDDKPLLNWISFRHDNHDQLVMAPLDQKGTQTSHLVNLIRNLDKEKQGYEVGRLLYVATTRAKQQLHLVGSVSLTEKQLAEEVVQIKPAERSLLAALWEGQKSSFEVLVDQYEAQQTAKTTEIDVIKVPRLAEQRNRFFNKEVVSAVEVEMANDQSGQSSADQNSSQQALKAICIGNLVHAVLEQLVTIDEQQWNPLFIETQSDLYRYWLAEQGLRGSLLDEALLRVKDSLINTVQHPQARWALQQSHNQSETEFALTSRGLHFKDESNAIDMHHIVDRTFVDQGTRWIIDYKTSFWDESFTETETEFLDKQIEHYGEQLERYGSLFKELEHLPQKRVLFFTHLQQWIELD